LGSPGFPARRPPEPVSRVADLSAVVVGQELHRGRTRLTDGEALGACPATMPVSMMTLFACLWLS
jgi:hypothetical protein